MSHRIRPSARKDPSRRLLTGAALGLMFLLLTGCGTRTPAVSRPRTTPPVTAAAATPPVVSADATSGAGAPLPAPIARIAAPRPSTEIAGPRTTPVPILMYHVVGMPPAHAAYPGLYVRPDDLVAQLRWLSAHGYHAVTLRQAYDFWQGRGSLPSHPVVLSFDDGYPADFTIVAPLLKSMGWPGVLNLIAGRGVATRMPTPQVQAMVAAGWEIDSHTVSHLDLTTLDSSRLAWELAQSRSKLQRLFGVPVDFFCYPSGRYDARVVAAVVAAHYLGATTTRPGLARPSQMFTLHRVRVSGGESLASFAAEVEASR